MFDLFYAIDGVMLAFAVAAAVFAFKQAGERVVPRWFILAPGVFASAAAIALLSYPDVRDLLQLQVWSIASIGLLIGVARGAFMRLDSDHNWQLVRLKWSYDWLVIAVAVLVMSILQFASRSGCASRIPSRPRSSCQRCWPAPICSAPRWSHGPRRLDRPHRPARLERSRVLPNSEDR
jgi:hypothetical protein